MSNSKRTKNKLITPISKRTELNEMGVTDYQINRLASSYKLEYQYEPSKDDFVYYIIEKGYDPFFFLPDNGEEKNMSRCFTSGL